MEQINSINDVIKTIKCKFVHEKEIFIASNQTVWPCCFLWTETIKYPELKEKNLPSDKNWNSLKFHTLEEILNNDWYLNTLEKSWDPSHPKHFKTCLTTCGFNQASLNEIENE